MQVAAKPLLVEIDDTARKIADAELDHLRLPHGFRNVTVVQHMVGEHLF